MSKSFVSSLFQVEVEGEGFLKTGDGRYLSSDNGEYYLSYHGKNFKGKRIEPNLCRKKNACYFHIDAVDSIHLVAFGIIDLTEDGVYWVAGDVIGYVDPESDSGSDFENECDDVGEGVGEAEESGEGGGAVAEGVGKAEESGEGGGAVGEAEGSEVGGALLQGVGEDRFERLIRVFLEENDHVHTPPLVVIISKNEEPPVDDSPESQERRNKWRAEITKRAASTMIAYMGRTPLFYAIEKDNKLLESVGEDCITTIDEVWLNMVFDIHTEKEGAGAVASNAAKSMSKSEQSEPGIDKKAEKEGAAVDAGSMSKSDEPCTGNKAGKEGAGAAGSLSKSDEPCIDDKAEKEGAAVDAGVNIKAEIEVDAMGSEKRNKRRRM